jgi:hypothetical protein
MLKQDNDDLLLEAARLEASIGANPYSRFLRDHSARPAPEQASAIGRLIGGRVKASDRRFYPVLTEHEKAAVRGIKARRKAWSQAFDAATSARDFIAAAPTHRGVPVAAILRAWWGDRPSASDIDAAIEMLRRIRDGVEP